MFLIVKANVSTLKVIMTKVKKNPQQLEVYGYALSIGLAPKISKNLKNLEIPDKIFSFIFLCDLLSLS